VGHARYVGRVGALAVTLGVGWAMTTAAGVAYAEPTSDSSSSESSSPSSSTGASTDASSSPGSAASNSPAAQSSSPSSSGATGHGVTEDTADDDAPATGDEDAADDSVDDDVTEDADDEDAIEDVTVDDTADVTVDDTADVEDATEVHASSTPAASKNDHPVTTPVSPESLDPPAGVSTITSTAPDAMPTVVDPAAAVVDPAARTVAPASRTAAPTTAALTTVAPVVAPPPPTLVTAIADVVGALFQPLLNPAGGSPFQIPILTAVLSLVRNEFERIFAPRPTRVAVLPPATLVDPTQQHVLVIGVDGTNLGRILADDYNQNFFALMGESTTAASSIVGHTTISNPSWTSILTGVWGERTGVINNVFTPWTYDRWPTVFDQLESMDRDISTMTVANWNVINAISGAGTYGADVNSYVPQKAGDTNWLATDDAVADLTVDALGAADAPNFLFSYFVGVDENGHMYGGASEEYKLAIRNMDDNLGAIRAAIADREALGEKWTIIVVTDHGHQPQVGFGHGFQSPDETSTFVIAHGSAFTAGDVNSEYEIVDTTPTVISLFGGTPRAGSDGVPLTSLGAADQDPADLKQALLDAIASNDHPDLVTNVALGLRTIFATIPYYVFTLGDDGIDGLPSFLVLPARILFDGLYVLTNVPAQVVAFLTGVSGARLFPLLPPAAPNFPPADDDMPMDVLVCGAGPGATGQARCSAASVA